MKLSDTQRVILSAAAQHDTLLATPPAKLPTAARQAVLRSMIAKGLLEEVLAPREAIALGWRQDEDAAWIALRITAAGLAAIGVEPEATAHVPDPELGGLTPAEFEEEQELAQAALDAGIDLSVAPEDAPTAPAPAPRASLRDAAAAVLAAWDASPAQDATDNPISRAIEALRAVLAGKPARATREPGAPRKPREGTKQETVLAMLRREEGATIAQICEATGWQQHTVRGFFAGLKKRQGIEVQVLERVRQVGPNKEGARGSYTIYHLPA
jgi:hypothetical protein